MSREAAGELRWADGRGVARITLSGRVRKSYELTTCRTKPEAEERCKTLAGLAARFRKARVIDTPDARQLLETAASCAPALLPGVLQVAGELIGGELVDAAAPEVVTFAQFAKRWTDKKLHKLYPDHIADKDSDVDAKRLEKMGQIDVGGITLAEVHLDRVTLDHAQEVMRKLPEHAKRPATRKAYAQLMHRVLALAVFPCRIIKTNPLPRGFAPKSGKPPAYSYLYPVEDAALLGHEPVALARRVLFGFLAREGCRFGEAARLRFSDLDLDRGVITLDENKTDDPRAWALGAGVASALSAWKELRKAEAGDVVFVDEYNRPLSDESLAPQLRKDLEAAGVRRKELHIAGTNRQPIRVHDLRGTFITLALANGRSETWVADRTGHTSSQMINRYRRAARSASELGMGELLPLDLAIPEFRPRPEVRTAQDAPQPAAEPTVVAPVVVAEVPVNAVPLGSEFPGIAPELVGRQGFEPWTNGLKTPEKPEETDLNTRNDSKPVDEQAGEKTVPGAMRGNESEPDAVEVALADAITKAANAGAFDVLPKLVGELEARRRARLDVVDLASERAKRPRTKT